MDILHIDIADRIDEVIEGGRIGEARNRDLVRRKGRRRNFSEAERGCQAEDGKERENPKKMSKRKKVHNDKEKEKKRSGSRYCETNNYTIIRGEAKNILRRFLIFAIMSEMPKVVKTIFRLGRSSI